MVCYGAVCGLVLAMCGLAIDGFVLHTCAGFTFDLCEILPEAAERAHFEQVCCL